MKKSLLTLGAALLLSASSFAQDCNGTTTGFIDDYVGEAAPTGVFYWGVDGKGAYTVKRNGGSLEVTTTHGSSIWAPMGADLNTGDKTKAIYMDASGTPTLSTKITNPGDKTVEIYFSVMSNGKTGAEVQNVTAAKDGDKVTLWGGKIKAGETVEWSFDLSKGVSRAWAANAAGCSGTFIAGGSHCITDKGFDIKNVSGFEFTINEALDASPWNGPLKGYMVKVEKVALGKCESTDGNGSTALTDEEIADLDVKVFPNPANDVVNVSYNVPADESVVVRLSNSLGQEVASVEGDESSASIDVADLNGGLYFASIIVDGVVVSTQRVVVD